MATKSSGSNFLRLAAVLVVLGLAVGSIAKDTASFPRGSGGSSEKTSTAMTNLLTDFDIAKSNIKKLLAEDSHSSMDEQSQNTWRIVANELYIKHRAYSVEFELTNDHEKNCGARVASELRGIPDGRGGCYHRDGPYKNKIFMSPELPPQTALWIANHEYAHWLQDRRGNSYIEDKECDADLQALEYVGYFVGGFGRYCKNIGIEIQDISREELEKMKLDWAMG